MAKVSTSAQEAFDLGYLLKDKYSISMNRSRLIADAKEKALELADAGYTQPVRRTDIKVLGKTSLALFEAGITGMQYGKYISDHDAKIARKLAWVMSGGDLSAPTLVWHPTVPRHQRPRPPPSLRMRLVERHSQSND